MPSVEGGFGTSSSFTTSSANSGVGAAGNGRCPGLPSARLTSTGFAGRPGGRPVLGVLTRNPADRAKYRGCPCFAEACTKVPGVTGDRVRASSTHPPQKPRSQRAKYKNNVLQVACSYPVASSTVARSVRGQQDAFRISGQHVISSERIAQPRALATDPTHRSRSDHLASLCAVRAMPMRAPRITLPMPPSLALGTPRTARSHPRTIQANVIDDTTHHAITNLVIIRQARHRKRGATVFFSHSFDTTTPPHDFFRS